MSRIYSKLHGTQITKKSQFAVEKIINRCKWQYDTGIRIIWQKLYSGYYSNPPTGKGGCFKMNGNIDCLSKETKYRAEANRNFRTEKYVNN